MCFPLETWNRSLIAAFLSTVYLCYASIPYCQLKSVSPSPWRHPQPAESSRNPVHLVTKRLSKGKDTDSQAFADQLGGLKTPSWTGRGWVWLPRGSSVPFSVGRMHAHARRSLTVTTDRSLSTTRNESRPPCALLELPKGQEVMSIWDWVFCWLTTPTAPLSNPFRLTWLNLRQHGVNTNAIQFLPF